MAVKTVIVGRPNFLASEVGLRTITHTFDAESALKVVEDGRAIIKAGTIYPANDATAKGIVFQDVDVTEGDEVGALMVGGVYYNGRLNVTVSEAAKGVFGEIGLFAQDLPVGE